MTIQESISQLEQFRQELYEAFDLRRDALMELIDALSSTPDARSVVELSLSSFFRREYSSVYDAIAHFFQPSEPKKADEEWRAWEKKWVRLVAPYLPEPQRRKFWLFGTDVVPIPRIFARTLPDCTYVYQPNTVVRGNKPVTIGHQYSHLVSFPEKAYADDPPWAVPMVVRRVHSDEKATSMWGEQIKVLMEDETLPFHDDLCVHVGDSVYSAVTALGPVTEQEYENLVNVARASSNRVFYRQVPPVEKSSRGHPTWYGERFDLKDSSTWSEPDQVQETTLTTRKKRTYRVQLEGWHNLLMRGKKGFPMHKHPFTLIRAQVLDEQGQPVYRRTMWLIVIGKRRHELSLVEAWEAYSQRYDVEHYFRFGKQRLLMATYLTPDTEHEENWMWIVALANTQLWLARNVAESLPRPWEQYLPEAKSKTASPSAVQRDFGRIIRQIGTPAQPPKPRGKSPGRAKGELPPPRTRHPVIKKGRKVPKSA